MLGVRRAQDVLEAAALDRGLGLVLADERVVEEVEQFAFVGVSDEGLLQFVEGWEGLLGEPLFLGELVGDIEDFVLAGADVVFPDVVDVALHALGLAGFEGGEYAVWVGGFCALLL